MQADMDINDLEIKKCPYCGEKVEVSMCNDFSGSLECTKCFKSFESFTHNEVYGAVKRFNKFIGK